MQILSLNCNKFAGVKSDGKGDCFKIAVLEATAKAIKQFLNADADNLAILHEVNYRNIFFKHFQAIFDEGQYDMYLPTHLNDINRNGKKLRPYGCTLALSGKLSAWQQCDSLELNPNQHDYANKSVILKHGELYVIGVHMPYDTAFWEVLLSYYQKHCEKALLIIGDLNVCDEGTMRKEKLKELYSLGAIDTWIQSGKDELTPTCNTNRRIDYALMSDKAYAQFSDIQLQDLYRRQALSDHSALIAEIHK